MKQYLDLLSHVLLNGDSKSDRTGTGTLSVFGHQMRFDLSKGFPLVTTKKIHLKSVIHELLWMLSGDTNIKYLNDNGVKIWDEWADSIGELGPIYGEQWRSWPNFYDCDFTDPDIEGNCLMVAGKIDQISNVIESIKNNPDSRRHIVSAWNVSCIEDMALPPCHCFFQFYVNNNKLSCQLYQRSTDVFLGLPFNIASYALLTHMIAQQCDLEVGEFIHTSGDTHLYSNHIEQAMLQLTRQPLPLPKLIIKRKPDSIFDYKYDDFEIVEYSPHPHIKADVAV